MFPGIKVTFQFCRLSISNTSKISNKNIQGKLFLFNYWCWLLCKREVWNQYIGTHSKHNKYAQSSMTTHIQSLHFFLKWATNNLAKGPCSSIAFKCDCTYFFGTQIFLHQVKQSLLNLRNWHINCLIGCMCEHMKKCACDFPWWAAATKQCVKIKGSVKFNKYNYKIVHVKLPSF